jgi:hypothetical protein
MPETFCDIEYNGSVDSRTGRSLAGRKPDWRKVRTPQGSVPDNDRDGGFKAAGRKVPQRKYRLTRKGAVRVKRCGKSAPAGQ